ncbi:hypothetical protein K493DRAFT_317941 [Basidiobolus meristosporus CBS 931.73]|uniref:GYF domain-containing protein n=1 Tax=Basidiobolus meristosporus CBS 931.73 TaxID=1314790 RepID=A0A1Y1XXJ6_9FUNG|nr:hypothetical protein K493DRAFT_317941 [Basidiobolus meristosporus CBS 931.73]|eukprot:ORX90479.1 hypothetical protein K493DRAFT_317941 [Basidiobolus meristosporus CBS 931.73]
MKRKDQDLEFDFSEGLEQPKRRRGAVNLDGYGSEASSSDSEEEEVAPNADNKLDMNEVEGEVSDSNFDLNENGEPLMEAFNMKEELEEGSFDSQGNYVRNDKDPNAFHDNWLEGVTKTDMEKAKKAQEKQDAIRRSEQNKDMRDSNQWTVEELQMEILNLMQPHETVLNALSRLNGGRKKISRNQQLKNKKKGNETKTESAVSSAVEEKKKKAIERMTDLCDRMMAAGKFNIYEQTYEQIVRLLRIEERIPDDWIPGTQLITAFSELPDIDIDDGAAADADIANELWEYKWVGVDNNDGTYGPYPTSEMKSWQEQGFFDGGNIVVRRADQPDAQFVDLKSVNF